MNSLLLSFFVLGTLGAGALGGMVLSDYELDADGFGPGSRGGSWCRGDYADNDGCFFDEQCEEYMDGECEGLSEEECEERHEECREEGHEYCDHSEKKELKN